MSDRIMTCSAALAEALHEEMARDETIFILGAALTGMRPVVDFHFADFVTCAMDEFCNQAAKIRYMFGGQVSCRWWSGARTAPA